MKINTRKYGNSMVVDLHGQLSVDGDLKPLWEFVETVTASQASRMVLNLENISRLDCTGIGDLVGLHRALQESGAVLTLVNVVLRQKRMLELVGLLRVLTVCNDSDEALARYESDTDREEHACASRRICGPDALNTAAMMSQTK